MINTVASECATDSMSRLRLKVGGLVPMMLLSAFNRFRRLKPSGLGSKLSHKHDTREAITMKRQLIQLLIPSAALALSACAAIPVEMKSSATEAPKAVAPEPPPPPTLSERYPGSTGARAAAAKSASVNMASPMADKRDALTSTGYAVVSVQNHRLPAQQRLMAIRASKLDAYRGLTEQVYGQQLDARTTVADMVIQSDSFRSRVEGVIYGARLESITPVGDDTYETTLTLDGAVVNDLRLLYLEQLAFQRPR